MTATLPPVWTDERVAELRQLASEKKLSASQIGAILGCTRNAVLGKLSRLGDNLRSTDVSWTAERVALLKRKLADDVPADQIAAELGASRNAVYRKAHRLGIERARKPKQPTKRHRQRTNPVDRTKSLHALFDLTAIEDIDFPDDPITAGEHITGATPAILALTSLSCKWPIGDPRSPDFHFCMATKLDESPYCRKHHKIAYKPLPVDRQRRAA